MKCLPGSLKGTSKNRRYSSAATEMPTNDSASFPFRFIDVHAGAVRDRHREQFFEVPFRDFTVAGGLMAYGPNNEEMFRRVALFIDKIFKGRKPADLPVEAPTRFELVINLKTAKALGLDVPPTLLARADEVIE